MTQMMKRNLSIAAIVIASIAFGMVLTADLGLVKQSRAQQKLQVGSSDSAPPMTAVTIPSFASIAERVMPAVVSITSTEVVRQTDMRKRGGGGVDPFDFFFPDPHRRRGQSPGEEEDEERPQQSGGSGFIISTDGYIITNNHVIEDATKVEVHYGTEDKVASARIIGRDPSTDLALIKIDVDEELPTVRMGNSDSIRVGDWALAIGNPLQFANTLTVGVISAKGRSLGISEATQSFENFIQTDAAINFGNSGGPLLNINGEVIGINTAIRAYAQNLGFATPVNVAKKILPQLRDKGKVTRGYLGIRVADVDMKAKEAFNLPSARGVLVESVERGQPADKAGIQNGDAIVKVDDVEVRKTRDLIDYVSDQPPGTSVRVEVYRNGERRTLTAKTAARPDVRGAANDEVNDDPKRPVRNKIGMSVQELSSSSRRMYGIEEDVEGVIVTSVKPISAAADANITEGDVVTEVNRTKITSADQFREIVEAAKPGTYLRMYVTRFARGGRSNSFFALVKVEEPTR